MSPSSFNGNHSFGKSLIEGGFFNSKLAEALKKTSELDKADGKQDGQISPSVWNEYAEENGYSKRVLGISVGEAIQKIVEANNKSNIKPQDAPEVDTPSD